MLGERRSLKLNNAGRISTERLGVGKGLRTAAHGIGNLSAVDDGGLFCRLALTVLISEVRRTRSLVSGGGSASLVNVINLRRYF